MTCSPGGGGGGGGHSATEGGRTRVTYFAEEGVWGPKSLTIHEIYAALTPSDSRSDWASEFAAATCGR